MVENLPSKAGDEVSHLGRGARILHALGQLSLCATTGEAAFQSPRATTTEPVVTSVLAEFNLHPSP